MLPEKLFCGRQGFDKDYPLIIQCDISGMNVYHFSNRQHCNCYCDECKGKDSSINYPDLSIKLVWKSRIHLL